MIIVIITLFSFTGFSQNMKLITYPASNGIEYKPGMPVYFGSGTKTDRSFKYIQSNTTGSDGNYNLQATWIGRFMEVKRIKQAGTKKAGYRVYLICSNSNTLNYWIEIENAIRSGEVVNPVESEN